MKFKYILDSFAWVEYAIGSFMGEFVDFLLNKAECFTPSIVIAELSYKFHRENKLKDWGLLYKFIKNSTQILPLSEMLAFQSGHQKTKLREKQLPGEQKVGLADAIIYQTSLNHEAKLVSGDKHFKNIKNVVYLKNKIKIKQEMKKINKSESKNNQLVFDNIILKKIDKCKKEFIFMLKIVRINLETKNIIKEPVEKRHSYEFYGGRSLSAKIMLDEVNPKVDPLSKDNKLIFASGLLGGTFAPNSGRFSIGSKSPLTKGIKEANVGGLAPTLLCRTGIKALIFEGKASNWQILKIEDDKIELVDADPYVGMNNYELDIKLSKKFGSKIGVFSIGIAREKQLKAASIASMDLEGYPSRHAGRGGLGAVMGSKKLKAVIISPPKINQISYHDKKSFQQVALKWGKNLQETKKGFSKFGTLMGLMTMDSVHGLPTQNFRSGSFKDADKISGEALHQYLLKNNGKFSVSCSPGCMIRCSNIVFDKDGKHITSSLEYETVALNGSNLLINDLEKLAIIDHVCDDFGLDTIEVGNALAVFMETGIIKWGDADGCIALLNAIKNDDNNSLILGNGAVQVGSALNISRVAHVKGQGLPGYDPRTFKGMGVTFVTSPMGADHTAGAAIVNRTPDSDLDYGKLHTPKNKLELSKRLQIFTMILDSMGQCYFIGPNIENMSKLAKMLNARYEWDLKTEDLVEMGKKWLKIERDFNINADLDATDDLPMFMKKENLIDLPDRSWDIDPKEISSFWKKL